MKCTKCKKTTFFNFFNKTCIYCRIFTTDLEILELQRSHLVDRISALERILICHKKRIYSLQKDLVDSQIDKDRYNTYRDLVHRIVNRPHDP